MWSARLAHLARFVIAVCDAEGRLAASVGPASRVRVVHNGIDGPPRRPGRAPECWSSGAADR